MDIISNTLQFFFMVFLFWLVMRGIGEEFNYLIEENKKDKAREYARKLSEYRSNK